MIFVFVPKQINYINELYFGRAFYGYDITFYLWQVDITK